MDKKTDIHVKPSLKANYYPRVSRGKKTHKNPCDLDLWLITL